MRALSQTDVGRQRTGNEDAVHVDTDLGLLVVSDGMGGHAAGEVASKMAIEAAREHIEAHRDDLIEWRSSIEGPPEGELADLVEAAALSACARVFDHASGSFEHAGMGCTLTLLLVVDRRAVMAHVGDSRLYLLRGGVCHQVSVDHTLIHELVASGAIKPADAAKHPYRNVLTRALGAQRALEVDTLELPLQTGDRFLLCSDGFSGYVPGLDWLASQLEAPFEEIPQALVDYANEAGGSDNISVVLAEIEAGGDETQPVEIAADAAALAPLFGQLRLAEYVRLMGAGETMPVPAGELVAAGQPAGGMWICLEGRLAVGDRQLEVGAGVGAAALFAPRQAVAPLRALESSRVLRLERERLLALCRRRPRLGVKLLSRLSARISRADDPLLDG